MVRERTLSSESFQKAATLVAMTLVISLLILLVPAAARADVNPANAGVQAGVTSRLYHAGIYKHGAVKVSVANGVATLTGTVDSYGEELKAVHEARQQKGVTKVVDNIRVNTADVGTRQILTQASRDVLTYPFYTIFDHITLSAKGNELAVAGQVTLPFKKSDLGIILAGIRGVAKLQNNIQVLPLSTMDDQIRLAVARRIYGDPLFVNYANQANPPIHIVVDNGNVTLYGAVDSNVLRMKAQLDARFAATYFRLNNKLRVAA